MRPPFCCDGPPAAVWADGPPSGRLKRAGHRTGVPRQQMARAHLSPLWLRRPVTLLIKWLSATSQVLCEEGTENRRVGTVLMPSEHELPL